MLINAQTIESLLLNELSEAEAEACLRQLTPDNINAEILAHCLNLMQTHAQPIPQLPMSVMDCCGTGGSGQDAFNTSTTVAFILAAGGVPVVKFGNRGVTRSSGSFDLLESIGIPPQFPLNNLPGLLETFGLAFLFAPQCYPVFAHFNQLRKKLGIRTVFNFTGPLLNPVQPAYRLLGVSHKKMQNLMADYLFQTKTIDRAWLVNAENGLDEIDPMGKTNIIELTKNDPAKSTILDESRKGLNPQSRDSSGNEAQRSKRSGRGGSGRAATSSPVLSAGEDSPKINNPQIFNAIITNQDTQSIYYQTVCINAAAGFLIANKVNNIEEGLELTKNLLKSNAVEKKLIQVRRAYEQYSG